MGFMQPTANSPMAVPILTLVLDSTVSCHLAGASLRGHAVTAGEAASLLAEPSSFPDVISTFVKLGGGRRRDVIQEIVLIVRGGGIPSNSCNATRHPSSWVVVVARWRGSLHSSRFCPATSYGAVQATSRQ